MAKRIALTPQKTATGSWRVNVPPKLSQSGKRERHFFPTREKAVAAVSKLKEDREEFGNQAKAVPPALAEAATAATALLEPLGIGLLEAVRRFVEAETRLRASVPIEAAIAAFRACKESASDVQIRAYRLRGEKLIAEFPNRLISTITGEELQRHLETTTGGPGAFNQNMRLVRAIWRWCAKPPRKWCELEPTQQLEAQESVSGEIGVLTAAQAAAVMAAAETYYPEAVPGFAIGLFTGMRNQEIARLTPADVTAEGITVPATSAKTKRRRFIQMPAPLAVWLKVYPITDSVTPPDWRRKQIAVRRLAGFKVWSNLVPKLKLEPKLEAAPPDDLPEWPDNALRHTAATMAVALGKPLETLTFEHGHMGGLEMLRRHYVGALPKAEALKIWSLGPHGTLVPRLAAVGE